MTPEAVTPEAGSGPIRAGTPAFRRTSLAMFVGGYATFALLYCPQPLMPVLTAEFGINPARSSLVVSFATGALALAILVAGTVSDRVGRKGIMTLSLALSAILTLAAAAAPDFGTLLGARLLLGVALSGVPSVSMAYLGEEIEPRAVGYAIGLFIGGSALGGMSGRFSAAALTDLWGWRVALAIEGASALAAALIFWSSLPPSRHFRPTPAGGIGWIAGFVRHLSDQGLPLLYLVAFLAMGCFVSVYNYLGFRLMAPPYDFSQTAIGALFCVYILGTGASTLAGRLADRFGRRRILWPALLVEAAGVQLTRTHSVTVIITGVAIVTIGFFAAHSIATSWVARRARQGRGQATALYMLAYYLGSSVVGWWSGTVWADSGWPGLATALSLLLGLAVAIGLRLGQIRPLPEPTPPIESSP